MAKTAKTSESSASAPVPTPKKEKVEKKEKATKKEEVPAPVAPVVPVEEKAPKKERAPKKEKAAAAVVASEPVVEAPAAVEQEQVNIDTIVAKVKTFMALGAEILKDVRALEKSHTRKLKEAQKAGQKKKRKSSNPNQTGGFTKQIAISNSLADFLGKERGSTLSHIEATKEINAYIKAHSLQNKDKSIGGGRVILADEKLCKLFGLTAEAIASGKLTYFNLQTYIAPHFKKSAPAVASA